MIKRTLSALFGALVFGILVPIAWLLAFGNSIPLLVLIGSGLALGALLGALFPRVFGFIFEMFFDG